MRLGSKPFRARQLMKLDVQARRGRHRGDDGSRQGFPRAARWSAPRSNYPRSSRPRWPRTARASGCCRAATTRPSRWCSSRRRTAARCASPRRWAARSIARSAPPRSRASTATSPPRRSSARCGSPIASSSREQGWKTGDDRIITNIVLMGMGEPLANFRNVMPAHPHFPRRSRLRYLAPPRDAVHLRPRAADLQARRRSELRAGRVAARAERRAAQRAGADQPQAQHRRAARSLLALSRRAERPQRHVRVRDARWRQRPAGTGARARAGCCATSRRRSISFRSTRSPERSIAARRWRPSSGSATSSCSAG